MSLRISLNGIRYPGSHKDLIHTLDLALDPGDLLLIKGGNGSGKTTLLNCLAGVIPEHVPILGKIDVLLKNVALHDIPLRQKATLLSYQMSDPDPQILFPSLEKELAFPLENQGLPIEEMRHRIHSAAARFGLSMLLDKDPQCFSHGQKKLMILAVCLVMDTPLILLDEPSEGLSIQARALLCDWIKDELRQGKIILAAEHRDTLNSLSTRILDLDEAHF